MCWGICVPENSLGFLLDASLDLFHRQSTQQFVQAQGVVGRWEQRTLGLGTVTPCATFCPFVARGTVEALP